MSDLIRREDVQAMIVLACKSHDRSDVIMAIRRGVKNISSADAVPVEWLESKLKEALREGMRPDEVEAVDMVLWMWQKEQEAKRNG